MGFDTIDINLVNLVEDCFNVTLAYDDQCFVLNNIGFIVPLDLKQTPR